MSHESCSWLNPAHASAIHTTFESWLSKLSLLNLRGQNCAHTVTTFTALQLGPGCNGRSCGLRRCEGRGCGLFFTRSCMQ